MHTKKRILSLLLAALLMTGIFPVSAFAAESDPVSGDISVHTAAELAALGGHAVEGNITLKADIDMSGVSMTPITSLKGCFNGDGKTISNLTLKGGSGSYNWQTSTVYVNTGLIGELDGSVINLKLSGLSIVESIGSYNNVGALVGKIADGSQSKIENCTVQGAITSTGGSGNTLIGGLAGMMSGGTDAHTALTSLTCSNFYYDNEKNPSPSSWSSFEMLNKGGSSISSAVTGKTTAELKALKLDGFEVRSGAFDAYPVPVWTPAAAPDPIAPPAPPFSCALTFENTQGGKITVKNSEGVEIAANEDGSYTLPATGEYTYLSCSDGNIRLAKRNETGKAPEATATLKWTMDNRSLRRPVTVNIYPAAADPNTSARKTLMDRIAAAYANRSDDWVVFDMVAYKTCGFGKNTTDQQNYLNLTIPELAGSSPLVTDRAKAEIILAALGVDSTRLTPLNGTEYSNAAKLAAMDLGSSHYAAPWVLLAEQAGQVKLTDAQRDSMIALLTDNLGADGLFVTKWGGETYADPDTTGTALAALAAYNTESYPQVQQFISRAVNGLSQAQRSNGSFGNVNSDAMITAGLAALGVDPSRDSRFVKGGCGLADALMLYVNDAKNSFTTGYISGAQGEKAQALATEQGFRALITLEQFSKDPSHAFNIYTRKSASTDLPEPTPVQPGAATDTGSIPSQGGSTGSGSSWMTVALNIKPDNSSAWYAGSVKTQQNATVQQVLETAASDAGLEMDIKDGYLRSVSHNGVTLGQFDLGPNSGWIYRVNGAYQNVGIDSYAVQRGDRIDPSAKTGSHSPTSTATGHMTRSSTNTKTACLPAPRRRPSARPTRSPANRWLPSCTAMRSIRATM